MLSNQIWFFLCYVKLRNEYHKLYKNLNILNKLLLKKLNSNNKILCNYIYTNYFGKNIDNQKKNKLFYKFNKNCNKH